MVVMKLSGFTFECSSVACSGDGLDIVPLMVSTRRLGDRAEEKKFLFKITLMNIGSSVSILKIYSQISLSCLDDEQTGCSSTSYCVRLKVWRSED